MTPQNWKDKFNKAIGENSDLVKLNKQLHAKLESMESSGYKKKYVQINQQFADVERRNKQLSAENKTLRKQNASLQGKAEGLEVKSHSLQMKVYDIEKSELDAQRELARLASAYDIDKKMLDRLHDFVVREIVPLNPERYSDAITVQIVMVAISDLKNQILKDKISGLYIKEKGEAK